METADPFSSVQKKKVGKKEEVKKKEPWEKKEGEEHHDGVKFKSYKDWTFDKDQFKGGEDNKREGEKPVDELDKPLAYDKLIKMLTGS